MSENLRLDQLVELRKDKKAFGKDPTKPYVGLEDMGSGHSGIQNWRPSTTSTSVNSLFRQGDVLFGKLRPELRKCESASTDGYCSTDILVLRPKAGFDPGYVGRVFQSTPVSEAAIHTAEGTGMPRASWRALSRFEVPRHPIAEQRKIAAILDALDESIRSTERLLAKLRQVRLGLLLEVFGTPTELFVLLDDVAIRGSGHTPDKLVPSYWNGDIKWVSLADSNKLDQLYIHETDKNISDLGIVNSSAVKHPSGTVIVSRDAGVGKSAILADEMAVSQHFITWRCRPGLSNMYLYYWLQYMKPRFESIAMGSTIKTIGLPYFRKLKISLPLRSKQDEDANLLLQADAAIVMQHRILIKIRQVKQGLMENLLTGRARVTV